MCIYLYITLMQSQNLVKDPTLSETGTTNRHVAVLCLFMNSQGPKVSDEKLREMCSAVVEGEVCSFKFDLISSLSL